MTTEANAAAQLIHRLRAAGIDEIYDDDISAAADLVRLLTGVRLIGYTAGLTAGLRKALKIAEQPALYVGPRIDGESTGDWQRRAIEAFTGEQNDAR